MHCPERGEVSGRTPLTKLTRELADRFAAKLQELSQSSDGYEVCATSCSGIFDASESVDERGVQLVRRECGQPLGFCALVVDLGVSPEA
jgi:hypothetical protein